MFLISKQKLAPFIIIYAILYVNTTTRVIYLYLFIDNSERTFHKLIKAANQTQYQDMKMEINRKQSFYKFQQIQQNTVTLGGLFLNRNEIETDGDEIK